MTQGLGLDLGRPRDMGELFKDSLLLYAGHSGGCSTPVSSSNAAAVARRATSRARPSAKMSAEDSTNATPLLEPTALDETASPQLVSAMFRGP